jgi:hypothetical protein
MDHYSHHANEHCCSSEDRPFSVHAVYIVTDSAGRELARFDNCADAVCANRTAFGRVQSTVVRSSDGAAMTEPKPLGKWHRWADRPEAMPEAELEGLDD